MEDVLEFPTAWRKVFIPRRGGEAGPALKWDRARGAALVTASVEVPLEHPDSDPALVAAARAYLDDPAAGPSSGAGIVAALVAAGMGWERPERLARLADVWIPARGVVFAASACVAAVGLDCGGYTFNRTPVPPRLTWRELPGWQFFPHWVALAGRVRAALAVAPDDVYAAAVTALSELRAHSPEWSAAASFLVPTQLDWVDEDLAAGTDQYLGKLQWCSAGSGEHLARFGTSAVWWLTHDAEAIATAVDGAGTAVTPYLAAALDSDRVNAEGQQRLLGALAQLPSDEAFTALLDRLDRRYAPLAALEAAGRFPRRALRLLAADGGRAAREMLRVHVLANRDLAAEELALLPAAGRSRVAAILEDAVAVPEAPPSALPSLLVTPPWTLRRDDATPRVLDLTFTEAPVIRWAPGEQDAWAAMRAPYAPWWALGTSLPEAVEHYRAGELDGHHEVTLMLTAPDALVEELLPGWRPKRVWDSPQWLPQLIARFGLLALPAALHVAESDPADCTEVLLPFASPAAALHVAATLARLKAVRPFAMAWFDRHAAYAAGALIPVALGPVSAAAARRAAEGALRLIATRHRDEVLAAVASYGPEVAAALGPLFGDDPLQVLPAKIPALPAWADPSLLPRILLAGRSAALGDDAARHVCTMLAISRPGEVYAGVRMIRDLVDRRSLAEFAWALFTRWQSAGAPAKDGWPLHALRWLGDDDTVRRLSPVIRAWPGEGGHSKAVIGLDVLAGIGSDLALVHLNGIAQKAKFQGLKERATQQVTQVAARLGLTAEQLADRLVPDLGLDAAGTLTLDYGPRQFVARFDEQLKPYVVDQSGARRKDLPKPGARDDRELAPAAYQRYSALKKDARTIAADQLHRIESAMVSQRVWTASSFRDHIATHPLLRHLARRLVWTAWPGGATGSEPAGVGTVAFRVAEDGSYADAGDGIYTLPAAATVRVAHPQLLGDQLSVWAAVFADYEILQPFAQLGRPVHELTAAERSSAELARFAGRKVPTKTLLGLERRGWQRGTPQDAGLQGWIWRPTLTGGAVVIDLNPGIPIGAHDIFSEQAVTAVWLNDHPWGDWRPGEPVNTFDTLDDITASEVLRDLTDILGP